jgi:hypothetical protein
MREMASKSQAVLDATTLTQREIVRAANLATATNHPLIGVLLDLIVRDVASDCAAEPLRLVSVDLVDTVAALLREKLAAAEADRWRAECERGQDIELVTHLEASARQSEWHVYLLKLTERILLARPTLRWSSLSF